MPCQSSVETPTSITDLFTTPLQTRRDGRIIVTQRGPVFGAAVDEFTALTDLLKPSEELTRWFAGHVAAEATCLLVKNTGRKVQVENESTADVPEGIVEAAVKALSAVENRAISDAQAAFPEKVCRPVNGVLHIGHLLVIAGSWHSDGNLLSCEPVLRSTIGIPGTRFQPPGATVSIKDDEKSPTRPVIDEPTTLPTYKDSVMSYFTESSVHRSPAPEETAAYLRENEWGARALCSVDIQIRSA